ncbi:hypothetical protein KDW_57530 [Dictyobacter vulcani]|uniref:Response regulatory domain-containing protein n=1 Tax=Dictyobacter vulcani TaxID=2607529 RepID=A0A5J4KYK8_9CHLR|nr:response regulator [Dictyobacter vulcani]GER91591.1 hypothetical protein KDW_57530 [Dictyobacter vulcani]
MHEEIPIVLIVDDDIPITEVLALVVRELGYQPLVAFNGQQALNIAREHWPALVLTDLMMPVLDGEGVVRGLHKEASKRDTTPPYIVMLTAAKLWSEVSLPVDAFISKPFEVEQIEQLIRSFLPPADSPNRTHFQSLFIVAMPAAIQGRQFWR